MLKSLSGRSHQVLTSVAVHTLNHDWQMTQSSEVTFGAISEHAIEVYCATQEPYDKAGGYGEN